MIVLLLCVGGLVVGLNYIGKNEQVVTPKDYVWVLLLLWGGVSAVGVLGRRAWAHKSFMPWAIVTGVAWCTTVFYFGPIVLCALLVAAMVVGGAPQAARVSRPE